MATYSLSALQTFTSGHPTDPFWIGVDVHKRSYHIALLRADSKTFTFTSQASPEAFVEQLRRLNILVAGVAYEAGPTGFSLARALLAEKLPVTVAAPSKIPRSVSAGSKTLARLSQAGPLYGQRDDPADCHPNRRGGSSACVAATAPSTGRQGAAV